jgi:ketosteroid isomerase-like protein
LRRVLEGGDVAAILARLDEDIDWKAPRNLPHGGEFRGRDAVGRFFQGIGEHWNDLKVEVEDIVSSGERSVVLVRANGQLRATGEATGYTAAHAWTARGDTFVRFAEYVDAPLTLPGAPAGG